MMTEFILLSTQRSGSSWVIDVLNNHPSVKTYSELFINRKPFIKGKDPLIWVGERDILPWYPYWMERRTQINSLLKPYFYFSYLKEIYSPGKRGNDIIGFKLMYNQLRHHPFILFYMRFYKVRVVHLIRENFLDAILSKEAVKIRKIHHSKSDSGTVRIHLDPSDLLKQLKWRETKVRWVRRIFSHIGLPYLEITYEELLFDEKRFNIIFKFLGAESGRQYLGSSLKKLNKGSHKEMIRNYDEIREVLKGTKYSRLLH